MGNQTDGARVHGELGLAVFVGERYGRQQLVAGEKVNVSIPLRYIGTAEGVKNSGGILEEILHMLHVRCDPANIPDHVDVDVTPIAIGHGLKVSDLNLPAGIEVLDDAKQPLCTVSAPKAEEVAAPVAGVEGAAAAPEAAAEPELIRKVKPEDEEGAEGEKKPEAKKAEGKKT